MVLVDRRSQRVDGADMANVTFEADDITSGAAVTRCYVTVPCRCARYASR